MVKQQPRRRRFTRRFRARRRTQSRNYQSGLRTVPLTIRETDAPVNELVVRGNVEVSYGALVKHGIAFCLNIPVVYSVPDAPAANLIPFIFQNAF